VFQTLHKDLATAADSLGRLNTAAIASDTVEETVQFFTVARLPSRVHISAAGLVARGLPNLYYLPCMQYTSISVQLYFSDGSG